MLKRFMVFIFIVGITSSMCFCQKVVKPALTMADFKNWQSINGQEISNDGNYVLYFISNPSHTKKTLIVRSLKASKEIKIYDVQSAQFTADSKSIICLKENDTLVIWRLLDNYSKTIPNVRSFKLQESFSGEFLLYSKSSPSNQLCVHNLKNDKNVVISNIEKYTISPNGNVILLETKKNVDFKNIYMLTWFDLTTNLQRDIWSGEKISNIIFDKKSEKIAFIGKATSGDKANKHLYYYDNGRGKAEIIPDTLITSIDKEFCLGSISGFTLDSKRLFISLTKNSSLAMETKPQSLKIWRYSDTKLLSQKEKEKTPFNYYALIDIPALSILLLNNENEFVGLPEDSYTNDDNVLVTHLKGNVDGRERNWNPAAKMTYYIASTRNNKRQLILEGNFVPSLRLSPNGKFIVYYETKLKNYVSYEIATGIFRNITANCKTAWTEFDNDYPDSASKTYPIVGWFEDYNGILLRDQNDIWQIDLADIQKPINLTNGKGKRDGLYFDMLLYRGQQVKLSEKVLLKAFNRDSKDVGFYQKKLGALGDPVFLSSGPNAYNDNSLILRNKAKGKDAHIIQSNKSGESPNLFYTNDFITVVKVSDVFPERNYNWYTSTLFRWILPNGKECQGILYKPENFDSTKKYPVILHYYQKRSQELNEYKQPEGTIGRMNIPWFVSNGYVVLVCDIHFNDNEVGKSVINSVLSATKTLSKCVWVDTNRIGIQGHSFAGYQTNYLVTHSNLFAAASTGAGVSNIVSHYNSLFPAIGVSNQYYYEIYQGRMGCTLWDNPEKFIRNSPIFLVDKISTPLLILHNDKDGIVPFSQSIEFFTALRRLGKKAWMLQYEGQEHVVSGEAEILDYTRRMSQFFDHYLKNAPVPFWMSGGSNSKGIATDFAYDLSGNCGKDCKVCKMWNEKFSKDSVATIKEINERKLEEH